MPPSHSDSSSLDIVSFTTESDSFGLYQTYPTKPTHIPEETLEKACKAPSLHKGPTIKGNARQAFLDISSAHIFPDDIFTPFSNPTSGIFTVWNYSGSQLKSALEADRFSQLQQDPYYKMEELKIFSLAYEMK
ncbi:hypothetical protein J3R82DRAFT_3578 [Butyriboletus roseoflavus]|nr:hypothetical protein J3R82DRAFT_3578 [Butyriboletus roseoflavus]